MYSHTYIYISFEPHQGQVLKMSSPIWVHMYVDRCIIMKGWKRFICENHVVLTSKSLPSFPNDMSRKLHVHPNWTSHL